MQKEIFEQPETVVNTMRGRICFDSNTGDQTVPDQALKIHRGTAGINYYFFHQFEVVQYRPCNTLCVVPTHAVSEQWSV